MRASPHAILLAAAVIAGSCARFAPADGLARERGAECAARVSSSRKLRLGNGQWLWIDPSAVVANGREVLLAGERATAAGVDSSGKRPSSSDPIVGAIIHRDGSINLVDAPIDIRQIRDVRAQVLPDGHWLYVFGEAEPGGDTAFMGGKVLKLWSGEFDGKRWRRLQEIALARRAASLSHQMSPMIRRGDTVLVAMPYGDDEPDTALLRYLDGRWTSERVATRRFAEVAIATDRSGTLMMAVIRGDHTLRSDDNSLFLYREGPPWGLVGRIARGGEEPTNWVIPVFAGTNWLAWFAAVRDSNRTIWELRARRLDPTGAPADTVVVLERGVSRFAATSAPSDEHGYIVTTTNEGTLPSRLRAFATTPSGVVRVLDIESPFEFLRTGVRIDAEHLLLVGGPHTRVGESELQTLLATIETPCASKR